MCEFVVNSFPFEIIMLGIAARRAGEPFVQQFLDKHSRSCWRPPPRCALFLRRATPTPFHFSRADVAFVCATLPAVPCLSVGSRQHGPTFPGRTPPLFAPPSPLRLIPPSGHANATGNFLTCWRIGILGNQKSGIVPTTIPRIFIKRLLFPIPLCQHLG